MKKIAFCLVLSLLLCIFFGCTENTSSNSSVGSVSENTSLVSSDDQTDTAESEKTNSEEEKLDIKCKLIVNGKDISSEYYVRMNILNKPGLWGYTELPFTAIMRELGADVKWTSDTTVDISYQDNHITLDTTILNFGIPKPPGGSVPTVRKIVDNEIIVDDNSIRGWLWGWMGATVYEDFNNYVVTITQKTQK